MKKVFINLSLLIILACVTLWVINFLVDVLSVAGTLLALGAVVGILAVLYVAIRLAIKLVNNFT